MKTKREWREEAKALREECLSLHRECREERKGHERTREAMLGALNRSSLQAERITDLEKGRDERVRELEEMVELRNQRAHSLVEREQALRRFKSAVRVRYPEAYRDAFAYLGWRIIDDEAGGEDAPTEEEAK